MEQPWWREYGFVTPQFDAFLSLEAKAVGVRQFQGHLVPGLLQTREYCRELLLRGPNDADGVRVGTEVRLRRQDVLNDGPEFRFLLDESVLHRQIGDPAVMREQLSHVRCMCDHPRMSLRVVPFSAGVHRGMRGSFTFLDLSDDPDDYALLLDHPYQDRLVTDQSEETREFADIYRELERIALSASETIDLIEQRLESVARAA